jgi:UDP-glucose 4-epimerase
MQCLILGGGGFLGSHLCRQLLLEGHGVRIFERVGRNRENLEPLSAKIDWIEGDFEDESQVGAVLAGIDVVFHLISTTLPQTSNDNPLYDIRTNLLPTLALLEQAKLKSVRKIVFFSSGGTVYGIPKKIPIAEEHPLNPLCSYGIQKVAIEKYLQLYHHLFDLAYIVLRIANPFGPRQKSFGGQGVIAAFTEKALRDENIEIWGDGSVVRDYLYVSDVANAALAALSYDGPQRIFNVGSGRGRSLTEVTEVIEEIVGHSLKIIRRPARRLDVPANVLDISRIKNELGWQPQVDFRQGIERTINSLRREGSR